MDKVIVLLSTFNGGKFLAEQLDSIVNQVVDAEVELYVRDDGSTDNTFDILENYKEKIRIRYAPNSGKINMGAAKSFWNLLMTSPRANYYLFCDQDDVWDLDKIASAINSIKKYEEKDSPYADNPLLYCCKGRLIDKNNNIISYDSNENVDVDFDIISHLISGEVPGCAMAFNNTFRDKVKEKNLNQIMMHDWVCLAYAILYDIVVYDKTVHYSRRMHNSNVVASLGKNKMKRYTDALKRWKSDKGLVSSFVGKILQEESDMLSPMQKKYLQRVYFSNFNICARFFVICSPTTKHNNRSAIRSFKLKLLLGLL